MLFCCRCCCGSAIGLGFSTDNSPIFLAISIIISRISLLFLSSSFALIVFVSSFFIASSPGSCFSFSRYGELSNVLAMSRAVWASAGLCINI